MIIGFTTRSQTVSEGDAPPGSDFNVLTIDVATERTSERAYTILFYVLDSSSTAIVESYVIQHNPLFDALFSNEEREGYRLEERFTLPPGESEISLITSIRNDNRPEDDECYTIGFYIYFYRLTYCYDDEDMADNYFCRHTICITNDDGRFVA